MPASAAVRKKPKTYPIPVPNPQPVTRPVSVAQFARVLGISRQRLYLLIKEGAVHATKMRGGVVFEPDEANRVMGCATVIDSTMGERILFDFDKV